MTQGDKQGEALSDTKQKPKIEKMDTDMVDTVKTVTEVQTSSDCPQSEIKDDVNEQKQDYEKSERNKDDGYDGDMEGDEDLMPPPSIIP